MLKFLLERRRVRKVKAHKEIFEEFRSQIINGWALIEMTINHANHYAWRYSNKKVSNVVPMNLRWKLELFEQIHTKVLPFEPLRDQAAELLTRLNAGFDYRHWCAHGALKSALPDQSSWVVAKDEFHKDGSITNVERAFTMRELIDTLNELTDLSNKLTAYCHALADQIDKHPLRH